MLPTLYFKRRQNPQHPTPNFFFFYKFCPVQAPNHISYQEILMWYHIPNFVKCGEKKIAWETWRLNDYLCILYYFYDIYILWYIQKLITIRRVKRYITMPLLFQPWDLEGFCCSIEGTQAHVQWTSGLQFYQTNVSDWLVGHICTTMIMNGKKNKAGEVTRYRERKKSETSIPLLGNTSSAHKPPL